MWAVPCPMVRAVVAPRVLDTRQKKHEKKHAASAAVRFAMRARRCGVGADASTSFASPPPFTRDDLEHVLRAVELSTGSDGLTQPHPKSGCVFVSVDGKVVAESFQMGQGGTRAERLAERAAHGTAKGGVAYLNLEPVHGPVAGETDAVQALVDAMVARVEIGVAHPVAGLRGQAVRALRLAGVSVRVLGVDVETEPINVVADLDADRGTTRDADESVTMSKEAATACRLANRALLYRCATGLPFSVLKYAMTLDGKIATTNGHSAWVTGPTARNEVWRERAKADAVIVGGTTVRRDNPNLTTRVVGEGRHRPARIVLSREMNLPGIDEKNLGLGTGDEDDLIGQPFPKTNLWDTSEAPTIVMTTIGSRPAFQAQLRECGVEVIEFTELTPLAVARYLAKRGFLQLFWECGGGLTGPALVDGVVHRVMAFVAPKIIGTAGGPAPTPVGETGLALMTDALQLRGVTLGVHGADVLISGYTPAKAVTGALFELFGGALENPVDTIGPFADDPVLDAEIAAASLADSSAAKNERTDDSVREGFTFYKAWDVHGALSNFSPHPIDMPLDWTRASRPEKESLKENKETGTTDRESLDEDKGAVTQNKETTFETTTRSWPTVEHFYQAQKFAGVRDERAVSAIRKIRAAISPEEAARIGRTTMRSFPELVRRDWNELKMDVMRAAVRAKTKAHPAVAALVIRSANSLIAEDSPHDFIWGTGADGTGTNLLGVMFMEIRDEMKQSSSEL